MPKFPLVLLRRSHLLDAQDHNQRQQTTITSLTRRESDLLNQLRWQRETTGDWRFVAIMGWLITTVELVLLLT